MFIKPGSLCLQKLHKNVTFPTLLHEVFLFSSFDVHSKMYLCKSMTQRLMTDQDKSR